MFFSHALRKSLIANFYCSHTPGQGMNAASFWLASNGCFTGSPTLTQRSRNKKFPSLRQCVPVWAWSTFQRSYRCLFPRNWMGQVKPETMKTPGHLWGSLRDQTLLSLRFRFLLGFGLLRYSNKIQKMYLYFFLHFTVMFTCLDSFVLSNYIISI